MNDGNLPRHSQSSVQERLGIASIQYYAAKKSQIWRETNTTDVGIDGQLEFVSSDGFSTGQLIAVQAKSGSSYFSHETNDCWKHYPDKKHRLYWEKFPIPVLLVLHDPRTEVTFWTDVRQQLRSPSRNEAAFLLVPKGNILQTTSPVDLFATAGANKQPFIPDLNDVLSLMLASKSPSASLPLTYFDLFCSGMVNICRSIYYGMDLILEVAEDNLSASNSEFGVGLGSPEDIFLFGFIEFIVAQNLAHVDISDCLVDWVDREMHPHFVAPLSSRGRQLVKIIHERESALIASGRLPESRARVAQEGLFRMQVDRMTERLSRLRLFQKP